MTISRKHLSYACLLLIISLLLSSCMLRAEGEFSTMQETYESSPEAQDTQDTKDTERDADTEPPAVDTSVTISMVGDVLLHEKVAESGDMGDGTYNYDHLFKNVKDEIEAADISIVNQEVILGGRDLGLTGYPSFNGAFEVGDALAKSGFDIVLHATNHTIDRGSVAVRNCLDFWKTSYPEMAILGINSTAEEQGNVYVREDVRYKRHSPPLRYALLR